MTMADPFRSRVVRELKKNKTAIGGIQSHEVRLISLTNRTGGAVEHGDIVALSNADAESVVNAPGAGAAAPLVVIVGGDNLAQVKCAPKGYGIVTVTCDANAVAPRDSIGTSATAGQARTLAVIAANTLLGFALESKGAGAGDVKILI